LPVLQIKRRYGKKPGKGFCSAQKLKNLQQLNLKIIQLRNKHRQEEERKLKRDKLTNMDLRRKRVRTLIQLGGLVEKSGILQPLQLQVGDDLQRNELCFDGAAILIGALSDLIKIIQEDETQAMLWRENGKRILAE